MHLNTAGVNQSQSAIASKHKSLSLATRSLRHGILVIPVAKTSGIIPPMRHGTEICNCYIRYMRYIYWYTITQ